MNHEQICCPVCRYLQRSSYILHLHCKFSEKCSCKSLDSHNNTYPHLCYSINDQTMYGSYIRVDSIGKQKVQGIGANRCKCEGAIDCESRPAINMEDSRSSSNWPSPAMVKFHHYTLQVISFCTHF